MLWSMVSHKDSTKLAQQKSLNPEQTKHTVICKKKNICLKYVDVCLFEVLLL